MNRTQYLNGILEELWDREDDDPPFVEFRPFQGWWLAYPEARWFGDPGDYLGCDWREAEVSIRRWM